MNPKNDRTEKKAPAEQTIIFTRQYRRDIIDKQRLLPPNRGQIAARQNEEQT